MKRKESKGAAAEYTISQMCRRTGYTADTLRFYEKAGLLPNVKRKGGRRAYTDADLRAVKLVDCMKKTGMPLGDIAEFMRLTTKGDSTVRRRLAMMRRREAAVRKMMADIQACADHIAFKVWYYETAAKEGLAVLADADAALARYRRETGRDLSL